MATMKPAKHVRAWTVIGLMLTAVVLARCGTAPSSAPQLAPTQPNRTSPLAASMRYLDAELVGFRTRFLEGDGDWTGAAFTEVDLNNLAPTDSSMLVDGYQALAIAFEKRIADFNAHPNPDSYSSVVTGCISCHQKACPGPLERISKRELPAGK